MKKIVLSLMVLVSSVFAMDIKPFVGIEVQSGSTDFKSVVNDKITGDTNNFDGDFDGDSLGFKVGATLDEKHRVYFSYTKATAGEEGEDLDYTLLAVNYDYLIHFAPLSLMIGGHIGNGTTEIPALNFDESGLNYGFQFGFLKDIAQNISLEAGYKFTFVDNEGKDEDMDEIFTFAHGNVGAFFFGINYKF